MFFMRSQMFERDPNFYANFRWYDWIVIYLVAEISSAVFMTILMGAVQSVFVLPILVLAWLLYENFRSTQHDKESD